MRATDTLFSTTAQFQILRVPTSSNGTTFGPGSNNNLLKSNGTSVYWTTLVSSDIPTLSITDKTSGTLPVTRGGTGVTAIANIQAGKDGDGNTISSTYLKLSGGILTGDLGILTGDTDKFLNFWYNTNKTAGASWRLGVLGSGSDDTNYFIIQSGTSTSTATTWNNVIRIGQNTYDAAFGGNIYPLTDNAKTLGTSSNKWSNVYSTTFTGNLTGNVTGNVTGSSGSCTGNAATATTLSANATDTTKVFFRGDRTWSNVIKQTSNAALGIDTNLKIGTAKKDLNFAITNGSGTGINDGYAGGITWGDDGSAYAGIYYQTSGSYGSRLIFGTTNSYANGVYARMIITSEGKVGIGRLIPSSLLGVDGTITLTGDLDITNYLFTLSLVNDKYSGRQGLKSSGYGQYYDGTGISAMESEAWLVYRDASGNVFLDGNAYSATRDGSGNTITSTYLKLSGGTMTGNLVAKKITIEHTSGEGQEYRVTYGSTVDMSLMIGTGNENHGIYDSKASKWMIYADVNGNVTVNGNAATATKATQDGSGNTITSTYLKLSGGSMTGRFTFNKVQNAIAYTGTKASYDMIKFIDNTNDANGNGIYIGGGGATIIGGGESADVAAGQVSGGNEVLYLCNDSDVTIFTNMQDGWASRKTFTFGSNGTLTASTFSGSLSGNAATATGVKDAGDTSKTLTIRYQGSSASATDWIPFYDGSGNLVPVSSTNLANKVRDKASGSWEINITGNAANVTGTVAVGHGGTGATSKSGARTNLGIKYKDISISKGATSASTGLSTSTTTVISALCTNPWSAVCIIQGIHPNNGVHYVVCKAVETGKANIRVFYFD